VYPNRYQLRLSSLLAGIKSYMLNFP